MDNIINYDNKELLKQFENKEPLIYDTIYVMGQYNNLGGISYITELSEYEYMVYYLDRTLWYKFNPYLKTVVVKTKFQWLLEQDKRGI